MEDWEGVTATAMCSEAQTQAGRHLPGRLISAQEQRESGEHRKQRIVHTTTIEIARLKFITR